MAWYADETSAKQTAWAADATGGAHGGSWPSWPKEFKTEMPSLAQSIQRWRRTTRRRTARERPWPTGPGSGRCGSGRRLRGLRQAAVEEASLMAPKTEGKQLRRQSRRADNQAPPRRTKEERRASFTRPLSSDPAQSAGSACSCPSCATCSGPAGRPARRQGAGVPLLPSCAP